MIVERREIQSFYLLILLLLVLFPFTGCGSSDSSSSDKGDNSLGIIKGTVTSASNIAFKGKPSLLKTAFAGNTGVSDVVCTLEGTDKSATTNENGFFQITNVAAGSYILICKKTATDGKVYAFLEIVEVQGGETVDLGTVEIKESGNIQGMATLTEQAYHTGISVYIPGTSMEARTDAIGEYLINDVPEGTYELHFEKDGYVTGKLTGILVTAGQTTLAGDINLNLSTGATGSISIESGKVYANSRTVTAYITASEDAKLYQMSGNPNFIGAVWNPIPPSRSWIFDSDGEKRLYIKFADANGLESAPVSDTIIIDTYPPINGSVSINNEASATNSTTVTLNLSATDVTTSVSQMMISNDPDFTNAYWESFASTRSWVILAGDGVKTVYVKYKDIVGNETTQAISDSITLDTTLPTGPSIIIQEGAYTNNPQIHLNLSASGATLMKISEDQSFTGVSSIPFVATTTFTLSGGDGHKTVYVKYIDDAGNETDSVSSSTILDTTPPTTPVIFNQNQTTNQVIFEMTLSSGSIDTNFANYQLKGGQYPDWTDTSETSAFSFTLTQEGTNTLSIRGKDRAGNIGNPASVTVILDTDCPIFSYIDADPAVTYAIITWKTNEDTTGKIEFGLNENYGTIVEDTTFATSHTIQLSGLLPETLYHYRIISIDSAGNRSVSTDLVFTTVKVKSITLGAVHACAVTTSGGAKCWGGNDWGQLGAGTNIYNNLLASVNVIGLSNGVASISTIGNYTCAITTTGGLKCWGRNDYGQLGDGTTTHRSSPVDVIGLSNGVASIVLSLDHTCVVTTSGGLKCWGRNDYGQLGDGTTTHRSIPVDVMGLSAGVKSIALGVDHTCAVITSGGVKCWGGNDWGHLGDGTQIDRSIPVDVTGLSSGVESIVMGDYNSCALTTSGGVKCWGRNNWGHLGDGTHSDRSIPVDVIGLSSGVATILIGYSHTCALATSGGVKCWGRNDDGQLGDGTTANRATPVDVIGLSSGIASISLQSDIIDPTDSRYGHTCVLTTSGGVKCWGGNQGGQLGDGTSTNRSSPVDVIGLSSGVASVVLGRGERFAGSISGGTYFNCDLSIAGDVKCWGDWGIWSAYGLIPTSIQGLH